MTRFLKFCSNHVFEIGEARHIKFRVLIDTERSASARMIYYINRDVIRVS